VTDQAVTATSARHAEIRPILDRISRNAIVSDGTTMTTFSASEYPDEESYEESTDIPSTPEDALWLVLCAAPNEGWGIEELMRETGMARATLYRHLRELAQQGHAYQVSRGHWRARTTEEPHHE
jgi:S-DNA-T family DNA segregation ATPase FtsK/SpoIIIE